jgi:hypothetical protein
MANGDPLRAKKIFDALDSEWYYRWLAWKSEKVKAQVPDFIVGMFAKE